MIPTSVEWPSLIKFDCPRTFEARSTMALAIGHIEPCGPTALTPRCRTLTHIEQYCMSVEIPGRKPVF